LAAPLMGLVIDRIGLNSGVTLAVGVWSMATVWTGWARDLWGLIASRFLLGAAQGGGVPAAGKAMSTYLEPRERALGQAMSQVGLSIGMIAAPLLAGFMEPRYGWRAAFLVAGALGLVWVPVWWAVARRAPVQPLDPGRRVFAVSELLRSRAYWGLIVAAMLIMSVQRKQLQLSCIKFLNFGLCTCKRLPACFCCARCQELSSHCPLKNQSWPSIWNLQVNIFLCQQQALNLIVGGGLLMSVFLSFPASRRWPHRITNICLTEPTCLTHLLTLLLFARSWIQHPVQVSTV
jgi:MFS family permease